MSLQPAETSSAARATTGVLPDAVRTSWVVTAPQELPRHTRRRLPWGTVHIRPNGVHRSACGQPTALWHTFWELPVDTSSPRMCSGCVDAAAAIEAERAGLR